MKNALNTVLEYLRHDSTWKGIVSVLTACGVAIKPELGEAIIAVGMSVVGLIQIFVTDADVQK